MVGFHFLQMTIDGFNDAKVNNERYPWDLNFYRAIENEKPIWEEQFPLTKLERKKSEFAEAGMLNKFAQEYMNDARDASAASFKIDRIKYHNGVFKSEDRFCFLDLNGESIPLNV